jgi:hypothetical protein
LKGGILSSLLALEALKLVGWEQVVLADGEGPLLPSLTKLVVGRVWELQVDAALPSLQLVVRESGIVLLQGEQLQLPQLSCLDLSLIGEVAEVDFGCMPALSQLGLREVEDIAATGLSSLAHLSSLTLGYHSAVMRAAVSEVLEAVPPALRSLEIDLEEEAMLDLGSVTQLTRLATNTAAILPQLALLRQLRELRLPGLSAEELSGKHLDELGDLPSLRKLSFGEAVQDDDARRKRMQVGPIGAFEFPGCYPGERICTCGRGSRAQGS